MCGVQVINKTTGDAFSADDETALEMFTAEVAIQLKRLSLDTAFEKVHAAATRSRRPLCDHAAVLCRSCVTVETTRKSS